MTPLVKAVSIAGGYVVAFLIASAIVAVRVASTNGPAAQASNGMFAFGDAVLFVGVFGVCALLPTGIALFSLSALRHFWTVLASLSLAVAGTGVAAAILFAVDRQAVPWPAATWAMVSVLRILMAPLLALTFLLCAVLAPRRFSRFAFVAATLTEVAVSAYGAAVWLVPVAFFAG